MASLPVRVVIGIQSCQVVHCQKGEPSFEGCILENFIPLHSLFLYFFDIIAEQFSYGI